MLSHVVRSIKRGIKLKVIQHLKRKGIVLLSDTTLRDGEQMPGLRLRPEAKVAIARALAAAGFHSIDAGFPAAAPEEVEAIRRIVAEVRGPILTAHCRTLAADIDRAAEALAEAPIHKRGVSLFLGTSPQHREHKHRRSKAEIIRMAVEAIAYAKQQRFVIIAFGPEDASRTEPDFLHEIYREAIAAGATTIGFADTVGILTPEKAADRIKAIQDSVPELSRALLGVHFHNDLGLGTANALACVAQGANIVQGTINGIGERAGNTALEEVVVALHLHRDQYRVKCGVDPRHLAGLSRLVARLTGLTPPPNKAVVGANVFTTEAGVHQDGLIKDPSTYLPFPPELIGADPVRLVLGKHSGQQAVRHRLRLHGRHLPDEQVRRVVEHLKLGARRRLYETEEDLDGLLREVFDEPQR
ncbi:MAG: pyruvate carboxyltransferase [Isosphaeraceae bacterium]|nr:pyruvate carboxyltransferase [Isosphaeraceae bacterium]